MSEIRPTAASMGMNLSSTTSQKKEGELNFALNAILEGFDGNKVTYQNELANIQCVIFPEGYRVVGLKTVIEKDFTLVFLANPLINASEIGKVTSCSYQKIINDSCLDFNISRPIHKIVSKITNCSTEFYWRDPLMRWIDLDNLPYREINNPDSCNSIITNEIDCNKLKIQPNFSIPNIEYRRIDSGGQLVEGDYQFAIQYANATGDPYTQYYSVTNEIPIFNEFKLSQDFNTVTDKSVAITISNIDISGVYNYLNIAVIKTINNIPSVELVETRNINNESTMTVVYTGTNHSPIFLTIDDIKERFPIYEKVDDVFNVADVLGWDGVNLTERYNFQKIFNKVELQWESHRISAEIGKGYKDALNVANLRGYMRDETYAFEGAFILDNGTITDAFHIPGRSSNIFDREIINNTDTKTGERCETPTSVPRWRIYNTGSSLGKIKDCEEINSGNPFGAATIFLTCSDGNCTHQGNISLKITFNVATPESILLSIGSVYQSSSGKFGNGTDIYSLPPGAVIDPYYGANAHLPFIVSIPSGVTSYDISEPIFLQGFSDPINTQWICHNCLFPITDLYLKAQTSSNYKIIFTTTQQIVINNIYPETPINIPSSSQGDCADGCYEGLYEWGQFAYTESIEHYPCEDVWGDLSDQPIRHHKFPDSLVSHIHDNKGNIYPIGVRIDIDQLKHIIRDADIPESIKRRIVGVKILRGNRATNKSIDAKGLIYNIGKYTKDKQDYFYPNYPFNDLRPDPFLSNWHTVDDSGANIERRLRGFETEDSRKRYTFHSPDTHFNQPSLGSILKLETIEYGKAKGHIVEVKDHARYKFLTRGTYNTALLAAIVVGLVSNEVGLTIKIFDGTAAYAAFAAVISIIDKTIPRNNFAYQSNSLGEYTKYLPIQNNGNKIRNLDIVSYLIPGNTSAGDVHPINNFQRESSVFLRSIGILPFPQDQGAPEDISRWTLASEGICDVWGDVKNKDISCYYASIKRDLLDQYGAIFSYETIDTGFQCMFDPYSLIPKGRKTIFGGDTFINRFGLKRKLPFFIDNKVRAVDDADIYYNDLGNVAYPTYWLSTDYKGDSVNSGGGRASINKLFGVKINNFDCKDDAKYYQRGKFYLFNYGISYFYVESQINVDMRQAFNDKEGDFFPHVGGDIPDDWMQETKTPIIQDNTYIYNKTYSKQNKETFYTHIPPDFDPECFKYFPNLAIYSDAQSDLINYKKNNWLIYRPASQFAFPLNYGKLISIEGMENKAILARFEQKSSIYNALQTINTSTPQAAYLGNEGFFKSSPPLDFAETDLGFNGTQHKLYLKTKYGAISVDAERGQIFLISGNKATDITSEEFKVDSFFKEHLKFHLKEYFPSINIDNHFNGIGITGVYDNRFERLLITKLDYIPKNNNIILIDGQFYLGDKKIELKDNKYFIDTSFTISFDLKHKVWVSFHSYLPNFYIPNSKYFSTGINNNNTQSFEHYKDITKYNNFFNKIEPYILDYPINYKVNDEILQSISDYTRVFKQINKTSTITSQNIFFNKAIIYNDEQCTGLLTLLPKPNNAREYLKYPKYNVDSREIIYTKSANFYNYNQFWDVINNYNEPIFLPSESTVDRDLNIQNMNYSSRSYKKYPIRGKNVHIRHILDNTDEYRFVSEFIVTLTQTSYK